MCCFPKYSEEDKCSGRLANCPQRFMSVFESVGSGIGSGKLCEKHLKQADSDERITGNKCYVSPRKRQRSCDGNEDEPSEKIAPKTSPNLGELLKKLSVLEKENQELRENNSHLYNQIKGVVLISLALCADAVIGNVQEKAMKAHRSSNTEVVLYSYGIGFVYILIGLVFSGGLWPAFQFCAQNPAQAYGLAFIFSITGYLGITFVLTLIKAFGALLAVTVTTGRKAVTMVLSFIFFAKPFTVHYVWSGLIVLLGIFFNVYSKNERPINAWFVQQRNKYLTYFSRRQKRTPLLENV